MTKQGPVVLFLGKWAKAVFSESGSNKTLTAQGKVVDFDDQCIVLERVENPHKLIRVLITRHYMSHLKQEAMQEETSA
jgi:hypothetical protein